MDDILFRHTASATPNDKSDDFLKRIAESDSDKALVKEAKQFDADLKALLKVDVPEGLADKILLEQSFTVEKERVMNGRWHIAIAASVAFIIGISLPLLNNITHSPADIGEVAMQHVQAEYYFTAKSNEHADLNMVNAKLARYGAQAHSDLGNVTYVNYCSFEGTPALHMVMQGEKGQITVFVVPSDADFIETKSFNNQYLKGITEKMGDANVVIVGERDESLQNVHSAMKNNIQWDI
ncbi:DUF3379 domain-containing protein [Psychromonas sp. psych-6C06]|uniref:DUF3379 family protein n=1 Tax=Psychromonas sp. psych-6C06 TaxID=2058089 RepID=UPI000C343CBC|nr:DUF3379 family protein [Psychromonas sp. psych-6C06]PKF62562.1 DUF3379 domain-containing protein [Psychromonas sp. psych-6C06]